MYTDVNKRVNGYQFFFDREENKDIPEEERKLKNFRIDYLIDGEVVFCENIGEVDERTLKKYQKKLNETIMVNLNLFDNWTESKKRTKRSSQLGIANMYRIDNTDTDGKIKISFIRSGICITTSTVTGVSKERLKRIKRICSQNMEYNLTCTQQCQAVTWIDILAII